MSSPWLLLALQSLAITNGNFLTHLLVIWKSISLLELYEFIALHFPDMKVLWPHHVFPLLVS